MGLLELPMEVMLEVAKDLTNKDLKHTIEAHPRLRAYLGKELHKRAIADKPEDLNSAADIGPTFPRYIRTLPAMEWAIKHNIHSMVEYLVNHDASGISPSGFWPALDSVPQHWARWEWGARFPGDNLGLRTEILLTMLQYAVKQGHDRNTFPSQMTELLQKWLLQFRATPTYASHEAGQMAHVQQYETRLLAYTGDEAAFGKGEEKVMRLLLQLGADPMSLSREHHVDRSLTPVRPTPQTFKAELPWILHILVEHGADLKWATPETGNLLHYATNTAQWPIVHALLRMGVNPDIGGPDDTWNPLNCAFFQSPFELRFTITESLLRAGANPDILHPDGDHSLHKLIEKPGCPTKVFRDLLPYCRNLNVRNSRGQTPLHLVMSSDSSKPSYSSSKLGWAGLLIEAKADVTRRDSSGKTIVERALQTEGGFEVPLFVPRHVPTISVEPNKYKHMLYLHLNFLTDMGLRFGIPSLIPAKAVYDQFHAEVVYSRKNMVYRSDEKHMLFICGWGLSNETLDLFLNVKDALGRLPGHGGKMGTQFRTFWDDNCSDINAQGRHNRVLSSRTSRPWMTDFDGLEDRAARLDL